jgi:hypothetical protein
MSQFFGLWWARTLDITRQEEEGKKREPGRMEKVEDPTVGVAGLVHHRSHPVTQVHQKDCRDS